MMKNDKVTYVDSKTKLVTNAVVVKVSTKRVEVVPVGKPELRISGPAQCFMPANFELPYPEPSQTSMDGYEVRNYKEYPRLSQETIAYNADIFLNGVKVACADNRGNGGCDCFTPANGFTQADVANLQKRAKAWWQECGGNVNAFETTDKWLDWYVNQKPCGITAKAYVQKYETEMAALFDR